MAVNDETKQARLNYITALKEARPTVRQTDMADALEITQQAISRKMRGETAFSLQDVEALTKCFEKFSPLNNIEREQKLALQPTLTIAAESAISVTKPLSSVVQARRGFVEFLAETRGISNAQMARWLGYKQGSTVTNKMHGRATFSEDDMTRLLKQFERIAPLSDEERAAFNTEIGALSKQHIDFAMRDETKTLKDFMSSILRARNMNQNALIAPTGIFQSALSCFLNGKTSTQECCPASQKKIAKLAATLGFEGQLLEKFNTLVAQTYGFQYCVSAEDIAQAACANERAL